MGESHHVITSKAMDRLAETVNHAAYGITD